MTAVPVTLTSIKDVPVSTYLVRGNAAKRILEHADEHDCGLIVMGSRGRGPNRKCTAGSTTQAVLPTAAVPVLIVHSSEAPARSQPASA
jgi:nucleotide-binding universal stress UspA family protein